jgi:hypothetical protein
MNDSTYLVNNKIITLIYKNTQPIKTAEKKVGSRVIGFLSFLGYLDKAF